MPTLTQLKQFSILLWILAALSFLAGLVALFSGGSFMDVDWETWYATSLVIGVLTVGVKLGVLIQK